MRSTRFLTLTKFHQQYYDELEYLYKIVFNNLTNSGIYITNEHEFHDDFINYIYRFSFKYKSPYDQ